MVNPSSFAHSGLRLWTPPDPLSESEIIIVLRRSEQSELVGLIAGAQRQLYAYILTLVADRDQADDVLQETNLVLWEKSNDYTPGTSFMAWAMRVAYFQTLAHLKRIKRDRLRFSDAVLQELAAAAAHQQPLADTRSRAMLDCVGKLSEEDQDLIRRRYMTDQRPEMIAAQVGRTGGAIRQALYRIRTALMGCIERTIAIQARQAGHGGQTGQTGQGGRGVTP